MIFPSVWKQSTTIGYRYINLGIFHRFFFGYTIIIETLQNWLFSLLTTLFRGIANPKPNTNLNKLNELLYQAEQKLLSPNGLPRRPWYRHTIYAPGFYTGYGVKTLPGIREAIEQRNWKEAQEQIEIASTSITEYSKQVDAASKILMLR